MRALYLRISEVLAAAGVAPSLKADVDAAFADLAPEAMVAEVPAATDAAPAGSGGVAGSTDVAAAGSGGAGTEALTRSPAPARTAPRTTEVHREAQAQADREVRQHDGQVERAFRP
jgi:hypothetical protein